MSAIQPTPETDEAWAKWPYAGPGVHANFARKLERERDTAKTLNRSLLDQLEAQAVQIEAMRKAMREAAVIVAQIPVAYDHRFFRAGQWANAALAQLQPHLCP